MKRLTVIISHVILFALIGVVSAHAAASMTSYCQAPPLKAAISPNIMLAIDVSGSMTDKAYTGTFDSTKWYEGYFDPLKYYTPLYKDVSGNTSFLFSDGSTTLYYEEEAYTGSTPCVKKDCNNYSCDSSDTGGCEAKGTHGCSSNKYACCTSWATEGDCGNPKSGKRLNFDKMKRIDLLRWAMTGGVPDGCVGNADDGSYCNPQQYDSQPSKVGKVCNPTTGCILNMSSGTNWSDKVRVPWDRVMSGLAFQFQKMTVVPRMGSMFYSGSGVRSAGQTYVGDFTAAASKSSYVFNNLIAAVNSIDPSGATPTGPVMWDVFNYFAQKDAEYGGIDPQGSATSNDSWKNPMYDCADQGGTNCTYIPCVDNFVILMSDGEWNTPGDKITSSSTAAELDDPDPVVPAYLMHNSFLNTKASVTTSVRGVYSIALFLGSATSTPSGQLAMKNVAMYGSYDKATTWPGNTSGFPQTCCGGWGCSSKGSLCTAIPATSTSWDSDNDGIPDTFSGGDSASEIKDAIMAAVQDILTHTSAGTAASVLASREGSGANLLQAVYYPKKSFTNATIGWVGNLQNLWYYIDPAFANSNIREDGRDGTGFHDKILNLNTSLSTQKDYITQFYFDPGLQAALADRWADANGDTSITGETKLTPPIKVDTVANIWEAGQLLWSRDWLSRKIYTADVAGTSILNDGLMSFSCEAHASCSKASVLKKYLNATNASGVPNDDVASVIMQWTIGNDGAYSDTYNPERRRRKATIGSTNLVWKLGDIINSTPKISTWQPLGDYNITYKQYETTYGPPGINVYQSEPKDDRYYTTTSQYKGRGMVYAGGNDGMLHAFRLGLLQSKWSGQETYEKAKLTNNVCSESKNIFCVPGLGQCPGTEICSATATLGDEVWAFIPKNVLPYLKYLMDPNYCHIYTVDLSPTVFDASIGYTSVCTQTNYYDCLKQTDSWRTVLIGGMRLGGACRSPLATCTNCVKSPMMDPDNAAKGFGYSSYFALDISNQDKPKLMWEYDGIKKDTDGIYRSKLGFSYSGPAVVRVSNSAKWGVTNAAQRNGRWFVVFGSGPTGRIDEANQSFMGLSDQNLLMNIFDLATGPGVDGANVTVVDTAIANGFSGSITTTTFDVDRDYSDDVLYVPYVSENLGLNGGIGRLVTRGSIDPSQWTWGRLITGIGPVTAAPDMLIDPETGDLWVYFGAGRYFFDNVNNTDDANPVNRRQIFGMKEICLNDAKKGFKLPCPTAVSFCGTPVSSSTCGTLTNVDNISVANNLETTKASSTDPDYKGWYINLDPALPVSSPTYWGERVITNPSVDASGIVYFTSFKPQNDPCYKGGQTNIWAVKFDTGGSATGLIQGTAIIQVSTGSIEQVDLSKAFTQRDNRRTAGMTGQPPTREGLTVIPGAPGVSKPLFIKER